MTPLHPQRLSSEKHNARCPQVFAVTAIPVRLKPLIDDEKIILVAKKGLQFQGMVVYDHR